MDKIIITNEYFMGIWSQNDINNYNINSNGNTNNMNDPFTDRSKNGKKERNHINSIEELNGTFYNISLENEKKNIILNEIKFQNNNEQISQTTKNNNNISNRGDSSDLILNTLKSKIIENSTCSFSSNYYIGSFGRILYIILIPVENNNTYKMNFIDYLFKYEPNTKYKANCTEGPEVTHESIRQIEKKIIFTYVNFQPDFTSDSTTHQSSKRNSSSNLNNNNSNNNTHNSNLNPAQEKDYLIMRYNKLSNTCAIVLNCLNAHFSTLILFMNETYQVTSFKLYELVSKYRLPLIKEKEKMILWVEDVEWICNDILIILLFSGGFFCILNTNFQVLSIVDTSNCLINECAIQRVSCPMNLYNLKLKFSEKLQLLSSKKRSDYFIIYSNTYTICFQANNKAFEARIVSQSKIENFDDFLYLLKFYQIHNTDPDTQKTIFEYIHMYIYNMHKDLYNINGEQLVPNENMHNIFRVFIRFIRIFRSINLLHETNLTVLNYLLQISNDFFYILINNKEIWLAFLFINICENYLLKYLRIKITKNKICEEQILKSQASYMLLNPYFVQNPCLKNHSKIRNKVLYSRLRLILIFLALIEFRNNQALNINVLYFVLAKNCIEKLKINNMLEDIQLIVKAIIRNYKYLKNENGRTGGEEYILNGLSMNHRSEILSNLIHSRVSRENIKFDFFNDFFPLEDMQNYQDINNYYFKGDEEILINEYNYMNNLGIIQKWLLLLSNFCYFFLFEEIKIYIDNHLRQYLNQVKSVENITPEETSLSNLVFFNFLFLQLSLNNTIKYFLSFFTQKQNYKSDNSFSADDPLLTEEYAKIFLPTLSPVDVPFLIYDFYILEDNKNKKKLPYEINETLNEKIMQHLKQYNFNINDAMDLIEFLMQNKFTSEAMNKDYDKIQKFIFVGFIFYFTNINKLSQLQAYENDRDFILRIIDSMDPSLKKETYDLIFIILNGYLRFYLSLENSNNLDPNASKYMEFILTFLKTIFYKLVREEPLKLRFNIHEYITVSPSIMKPYLFEGGMFYEYKTFNRIYKKSIFSNYSIIDIRYFDNMQKFYQRKKADLNSIIINSSSANIVNSNEKEKINNNKCIINNTSKKVIFNLDNDKQTALPINLNLVPNNLPEANNNPSNKNNSLNNSNINISNNQPLNFLEDNLYFLDELMDIGDEENDYANVGYNWFLENIFSTEDMNNFYKASIKNDLDRNTLEKKLVELKDSKIDFVKSLKNFLFLIKDSDQSNGNNLIYEIEQNKEHNRKIIINFIKEIKKNTNSHNHSETGSTDILGMFIDKIIIGNFEENINFKFSNSDIKKKIIKSIKLSIVKCLHILNILQIKYFVFKFYNPKKDLLNYLKNLSLLLIYDKNPSEAIKSSLYIIDTLINLNWKEKKKENEAMIIIDIIKNISITMIKYKKNLLNYSKYKVLDNYVAERNQELLGKINFFLNEEIVKINYVYENLEYFKSENLRLFFSSMFIDSYFKNLRTLQDNISYYLTKQNISNPLSKARKLYLKITEAYAFLTGIPQKGYIYFIENWDLVNNDVLHNMIINDNYDEFKNENNNIVAQGKKAFKDQFDFRYNFIMNRRQKYGVDTPRKEKNLRLNKNHLINIPNCKTPLNKISNSKINFLGKEETNMNGNTAKKNSSKNLSNLSTENEANLKIISNSRTNDSFYKGYDTDNSIDLREEKLENSNTDSLNNSFGSNKKLTHNRNLNIIRIKKNLKNNNTPITYNNKNNIPKYKKDIVYNKNKDNNLNSSFNSNNEVSVNENVLNINNNHNNINTEITRVLKDDPKKRKVCINSNSQKNLINLNENLNNNINTDIDKKIGKESYNNFLSIFI